MIIIQVFQKIPKLDNALAKLFRKLLNLLYKIFTMSIYYCDIAH